MLLQYDKGVRLWSVLQHAGAPSNPFARVILDAPAKGLRGGVYEISDASLKLDGDVLRIVRDTPVPGVVNGPEMREWCVALTEHEQRWLVYRQDRQDVTVTTDTLELDCHAVTTSDGLLHCNAQMLVVGKSNRLGKFVDAKHVKLRTLSAFPQKVDVQPTRMGSAARM